MKPDDPTRRTFMGSMVAAAAVVAFDSAYFFQTSPTPSPNHRVLTTFCWV